MRRRLLHKFRRVIFYAFAATPAGRYLYHRYSYNFDPGQLSYLVQCVAETKDLSGGIVAIGCAAGHTTVFLKKYMAAVGIAKSYICVDTFGGFLPTDMRYEEEVRGKDSRSYATSFSDVSLRLFRRTLANNSTRDVMAIQADINTINLRKHIPEIAFCLIDVDLYRPVESALSKVWELMSPGGIVVVDDCRPDVLWDGALDAYQTFAATKGLEALIVERKLGVLRKPR